MTNKYLEIQPIAVNVDVKTKKFVSLHNKSVDNEMVTEL